MKIVSIICYSWENGQVQVSLEDGTSVSFRMNEEESDRVRQIAADIFFSRQKAVAKEIATARPLMIELQPERVEPAPLEDDIPF